MKRNVKYICAAIFSGLATCALCVLAVVLYNSPKNFNNSNANSYELHDEEYIFDESDDFYEDEYYDEDYEVEDEEDYTQDNEEDLETVEDNIEE